MIPLTIMLNKYKVLFSHILICALVCSAIYLPFVITPFIRHDDYYYPAMSRIDNCRKNQEYAAHVGYGRIIQAELTRCALVPLSQKFTSVKFFIILRLIIMFSVALVAGLLSYWLRKVCACGQTLSILISTLIITLPGYTVYIGNSWFATITPAMISVMFAILILRDERITGNWREDLSDWKRMSLSLSCLLIALFNYQIFALLFLVPPAAVLIFGDQKTMEQKRNIALRYLMIFGAGLALYLILQKFIVLPAYLHFYPDSHFDLGYGEMAVETSIATLLSRLLFSFKMLLSRSFNLWFVLTEPKAAHFIFGTIGIAVFLFLVIEGGRAFLIHQFKHKAWCFLQTAGLLFCLYLGLQSPQFFYGNFLGFRITAHVSAMFVLLFVWSLRYILRLLLSRRSFERVFLAVIFMFTFIMAARAQYQSLHDWSSLTLAELDFLEAQLTPIIRRKASAAAIIRPVGNTKVGGDEHGMLTSCFDNDYGLQGMVRYIYKRNNRNPDSLRFTKKGDGRVIIVEDLNLLDQNIHNVIIIHMDVFLKTQLLPR